MVIEVVLSWEEVRLAALCGVDRRIDSRAKGLVDANRLPKGSVGNGEHGLWDIDINSAVSEMAFAKGFNRYWDASIGRYVGMGGDVGTINVKHTILDDGCLIVKDYEPADQKYALVIGKDNKFRIVGWAYGSEAKQDRYIYRGKNRSYEGVSYYLPWYRLSKIETLEVD